MSSNSEGVGDVSSFKDDAWIEGLLRVDDDVSFMLKTTIGDGGFLGDPWSSGHGWKVSKVN